MDKINFRPGHIGRVQGHISKILEVLPSQYVVKRGGLGEQYACNFDTFKPSHVNSYLMEQDLFMLAYRASKKTPTYVHEVQDMFESMTGHILKINPDNWEVSTNYEAELRIQVTGYNIPGSIHKSVVQSISNRGYREEGTDVIDTDKILGAKKEKSEESPAIESLNKPVKDLLRLINERAQSLTNDHWATVIEQLKIPNVSTFGETMFKHIYTEIMLPKIVAEIKSFLDDKDKIKPYPSGLELSGKYNTNSKIDYEKLNWMAEEKKMEERRNHNAGIARELSIFSSIEFILTDTGVAKIRHMNNMPINSNVEWHGYANLVFDVLPMTTESYLPGTLFSFPSSVLLGLTEDTGNLCIMVKKSQPSQEKKDQQAQLQEAELKQAKEQEHQEGTILLIDTKGSSMSGIMGDIDAGDDWFTITSFANLPPDINKELEALTCRKLQMIAHPLEWSQKRLHLHVHFELVREVGKIGIFGMPREMMKHQMKDQ